MSLTTTVKPHRPPSVLEPASRVPLRLPLATAGLLALTVLLAVPWARGSAVWRAVAVIAAAAVVVPVLVGGLQRRGAGRSDRRPAAHAAELLLHLAPVILLSLAFPLATARLSTAEAGQVPLTTLLLASSLTVPWLSQIVCMPLFEGVWDYTAVGDMRGLARRLLAAWPVSLVLALPAAALFAVPVALTMRWSAQVIGYYLVLLVLHLVFAQSLVYSIAAKKPAVWALGWAAYAGVFVAAPEYWYLPPLVGTLTQLGYLLAVARTWPRPIWVTGALPALGKGVLLGSLLWCDKFLYFLGWHGDFDAGLVFAAMLPAIVAYNYYFVVEAPRVDTLVNSLRGAMENEPLTTLRDRSVMVRSHIERSALRAAFLAALLGFGWVLAAGLRRPEAVGQTGSIVLASWCFVLASLLCYNLAYIGRSAVAHLYGAAHIALAATAFLLAPSPAVAYAALGVVEVLCLAYLVRVCFAEWRTPEYSLFWKHATRW